MPGPTEFIEELDLPAVDVGVVPSHVRVVDGGVSKLMPTQTLIDNLPAGPIGPAGESITGPTGATGPAGPEGGSTYLTVPEAVAATENWFLNAIQTTDGISGITNSNSKAGRLWFEFSHDSGESRYILTVKNKEDGGSDPPLQTYYIPDSVTLPFAVQLAFPDLISEGGIPGLSGSLTLPDEALPDAEAWAAFKKATAYITVRDGWLDSKVYSVYDVVTNGGRLYNCKVANLDVEPGVDAGWDTYWTLLAGGEEGVQSVVPGTGISVDNSDPANPIVSVSGLMGLEAWSAGSYAVNFPVTHDGKIAVSLHDSNTDEPGGVSDSHWNIYTSFSAFLKGMMDAAGA